MAQVGIAAAAQHLRPHREPAAVLLQRHVALGERLPETGPARSRVKLRPGVEQRLPAADAGIDTVLLRVPVGPGEGPFGALLARDAELLLGQLPAPRVIGFYYLVAHVAPPAYLSRLGAVAHRPPPVIVRPRHRRG